MINRLLKTLALSASLLLPAAAKADLLLTGVPRGDLATNKALYEPLASALSRSVDKKIVFEFLRHWSEYSAAVRAGRIQLMIDTPHFVAWRIKKMGHVPVVRVPGSASFYVVSNEPYSGLDALVGQKVCALASPNFGTLYVLSFLPNPLRQPMLVDTVGGDFGDLYKAFREGQCSAVILRNNFFENRISEEERKSLHIVFKTPDTPNQTLSVSSRDFTAAEIERMRSFLLSEEGAKAGSAFLNVYSPRDPKFIAAEPAEFKPFENLLDKNIWGW